MYIKWLAFHQSQNTGLSILTELQFLPLSLSLFPSGSKANWGFFSSRQNGHLEEKFGHAHTFLNIPDKISLLIYWVTSSYNLYSLKRGGRKEGGGWRTLSLILFSARTFPRVHCWSLEETNQALNEWIYCSIWSVVQSTTIDWKNAGNQWIFITVTCHHRLRGIRCACI